MIETNKVTEAQYEAAIPKCCSYQGLTQHVEGLGLCWSLVRALEENKPMNCSGCDLNLDNEIL